MRILALMWVVLGLTYSGTAQAVPTEKQTLKDADYALRRFEEVTARIDFNRLKAPGTTIGRSQEVVLNMTQTKYVDEAKAILARFDGKRKPTSTELLVLMADLERSANALLSLSDLVTNFQDPEASPPEAAQENALAGELATVSNTGYEAMTEVFLVLQDKIAGQEDLLKMCAQTAPPSKKKSGPSN